MLANGGIGRWVIAEGKEVIPGAWKKRKNSKPRRADFFEAKKAAA